MLRRRRLQPAHDLGRVARARARSGGASAESSTSGISARARYWRMRSMPLSGAGRCGRRGRAGSSAAFSHSSAREIRIDRDQLAADARRVAGGADRDGGRVGSALARRRARDRSRRRERRRGSRSRGRGASASDPRRLLAAEDRSSSSASASARPRGLRERRPRGLRLGARDRVSSREPRALDARGTAGSCRSAASSSTRASSGVLADLEAELARCASANMRSTERSTCSRRSDSTRSACEAASLDQHLVELERARARAPRERALERAARDADAAPTSRSRRSVGPPFEKAPQHQPVAAARCGPRRRRSAAPAGPTSATGWTIWRMSPRPRSSRLPTRLIALPASPCDRRNSAPAGRRRPLGSFHRARLRRPPRRRR